MKTATSQSSLFDLLVARLTTPPLLAGYSALVLLLLLSAMTRGMRQRITSGRWAGNKERHNARQAGLQQIYAADPGDVALHIGDSAGPQTVWIPHANCGIGVFGATGKGKSFSVFEPVLRSAIDQGFPAIVFDASGDHTRNQVAYALSQDYKVYFFAPGLPYSGSLNLLDFLENPQDSEMAEELAHVLRTNTQYQQTKGDPFFAPATDKLLKALILLAKDSPYPDIPMAFALLREPDLAQRLKAAQGLNLWAEIAATTLTSAADADRTVGGIVAGVSNLFDSLISARNLPCIIGQSTLPLDLEGKQMVILQYDGQRQAATAPLIAAAIHLLVKRNIGPHVRRSQPLVLSMDEFATSLYLPEVTKWVNLFRKYGLVTIAGIQSTAQLRALYGRETSDALMAGFVTRFIFNPNDPDTAFDLSKLLGETEIVTRTNSTTWSRGGRTRTVSEHLQRRSLLTPDEILRLPRGAAVLLNPEYASGGEANLPLRLRHIYVSKAEQAIQQDARELWDNVLCQRYTQRVQNLRQTLQNLDPPTALHQRQAVANMILPPIPQKAIKP